MKKIRIVIVSAVLIIVFVTSVYAYVPTPFLYSLEEGQTGMLVCESGTPYPYINNDNSVTLHCLFEDTLPVFTK